MSYSKIDDKDDKYDDYFKIYKSKELKMKVNDKETKPDHPKYELDNGNWYILGFRWEGITGIPTLSENGNNSHDGVNDEDVKDIASETTIPAGGVFSLAGKLKEGKEEYEKEYEEGKSHEGDFSEVILFNTFITEAERTIVVNYLSAKYAIAIDDSVDFYDEDTSGENFDYNVAGIGQAADGSKHTDSQGTGIVRINTPSTLTNGNFLFWGENVKDAEYSFSLVDGDLNYYDRLDTKWRVSKYTESGTDLGTVSVAVDASMINLNAQNACSTLKLMVSSSSTFASDVRYYDLSFDSVNNFYSTTEVEFNDNDYFTLGYVDEIVWDGEDAFHNGSGTSQEPTTGDACKKFLVKQGDTATLTDDAHVRELEVEDGGTLEITSGKILTITNGIINNGTIKVNLGGQVVQTHTGSTKNLGNGHFTIPQLGTENQYDYNYWSSSVNNGGTWKLSELEFGGVAVDFTSNVDADASSLPIEISTQWLQTFNGTSGNYYSWNQIYPESTLIKPGEGFSMKGPGTSSPEAFTFNGEANDGVYTLTAIKGNDYLVGNPYPSDLNADQFISDNSTVIDGTLYFWEQFGNADTHILRDYQGGYATYNSMMSLPSGGVEAKDAGTGSVKGAPTGKIAVGQGFFVTIDTSGYIEFNNAQRDVSAFSDAAAVFYKTTNSKSKAAAKTATDTRTKIWFTMGDESEFTRVIGLGYDAKATEGYDSGYDSYLANFYPDNFYWTLNGSKLMVQGLPSFSKTDVIDLGVEVVNSGTYTFGIYKSENLPENTPVYLKDKETKTYYNLLDETPVALELVAGTNYASRYAITYAKQADALSVDSEVLHQVTVFYKKEKQQLVINNYSDLNRISSLKIYSLSGQVILGLSNVESNTVQLPNISNGVYLVEIIDSEHGNVVKKFVKY